MVYLKTILTQNLQRDDQINEIGFIVTNLYLSSQI